MAVQLQTREVQVERINERGFKSTAGDWLNVSKFAGDVFMPIVGARVVVSLDKAGFVRKVAPVALVPITGQTAPQTPTGPMSGQATPEPSTSPAIEQDAKGTVLLRMNVMTTATTILSSGGRPVNPDEVLALAGRLEVWATR